MVILNQQKSTSSTNSQHNYNLFFFCRASPPIPCTCTFFILHNDKTCFDFSENVIFFKHILFHVKSQKNPCPKRILVALDFPKEKYFFIPENVS